MQSLPPHDPNSDLASAAPVAVESSLDPVTPDQPDQPEGPDDPRDYRKLIEVLKSLSRNKQIAVLESWSAVEIELDDGVTVTARSKKEFRRFTREKPTEMLDWLRSFDADEVFYDIGANCGSLTLAAAAMHRGHIEIVAIEPSFANFESLTRNLSQNGLLSSTIPLQVALLDRTGLERMNYYRSLDAGTSLHAIGDALDHEGRSFTPVEIQMIPAYALDDLIRMLGLPAPTRVKIDVDGHEEPVLKGAARTLKRGTIKELAVEIVDHDRAGTRMASIKHRLAGYGYELVESFRHGGDESFVADHLFRRRARRWS